MAKGKLPPQLVAYWEKKNKQQNQEDSKTEEGKERIRTRKATNAVKAAATYKKDKTESQAETKEETK